MKNRNSIYLVNGIILMLIFIFGGIFYYNNLRGATSAFFDPKENVTDLFKFDNALFTVQPGFQISIFEDNIPNARVMTFDYRGNLWVSQMDQGKVVMIDIENGISKGVYEFTVLLNLNKPHGLAFDPENPGRLYIAEENKIVYIDVYIQGIIDNPVDYQALADYELVKMSLAGSSIIYPQDVINLPMGGRHTSRTIGFGPDNRLYISIGSSCDVCYEQDPQRAAIYSIQKDGSDFKEVAKGLRNAVFFVFKDNKIWTTEMGRDQLGDDVPPDEINVIDISNPQVQHFGWPLCYGDNILDTDFEKNDYGANPCREPVYIASTIDLPAHSAPLGLAFVPENTNWGEEYTNDLLVAFYGSWNRTKPSGYKIVFLNFDDEGNYIDQEDFISGWLDDTGKTVLGRPTDLKFGPDKALYISDDTANVIYRLTHQ